jgi:hypothetical protein
VKDIQESINGFSLEPNIKDYWIRRCRSYKGDAQVEVTLWKYEFLHMLGSIASNSQENLYSLTEAHKQHCNVAFEWLNNPLLMLKTEVREGMRISSSSLAVCICCIRYLSAIKSVRVTIMDEFNQACIDPESLGNIIMEDGNLKEVSLVWDAIKLFSLDNCLKTPKYFREFKQKSEVKEVDKAFRYKLIQGVLAVCFLGPRITVRFLSTCFNYLPGAVEKRLFEDVDQGKLTPILLKFKEHWWAKCSVVAKSHSNLLLELPKDDGKYSQKSLGNTQGSSGGLEILRSLYDHGHQSTPESSAVVHPISKKNSRGSTSYESVEPENEAG